MRKMMRSAAAAASAIALAALLMAPARALDAGKTPFAPNPQTPYAASFIAKCEGQQWFMDEVERLLNMEQKALDLITGPADFGGITALGLKDAGISGKLPAAIGELKELKYVFLSGNKLGGAMPPELFSLGKLQELDLAGNKYAGAIPPQLGAMPSLRVLNLKWNGFTGGIPDEVLNNSKITILNLEGNKLSGGIPPGIGNMAGLAYLNLSKNAWGGAIPDISGLTELAALSMWECGLTGDIPACVYALSKLQILDLAYNGLSGEIAPAIGDLTELECLTLSSNKLTGGIPAAIGGLARLRTLNLSANRLRGTIPDIFGSGELKEIYLGGNYLRGTVPATLKARHDAGAAVDASNNYLTGAALKGMAGNAGNFTDGAAGAQYQLIFSQAAVQIGETAGTDIYALLRNRSKTTGNTTQKVLLYPGEYEVIYDAAKIEATITAQGIFIKALAEIPSADNETVTVRILGNDGSEYSKATLKVTTEAVSAGGGLGGGGGGAVGGVDDRDDEELDDEEVPLEEMHRPYIFGYPDGTFKPNGGVTREEIAAMMIRAMEITPGRHSVPSYADVATRRWSFAYIEEATERGFLNGYPDGSFRPTRAMTRAELATMLVRIARRRGMPESGPGASFTDIDSSAWYGSAVLAAARLGLAGGYADGTFRPDKPVSRAEAVAMINRLLGRDAESEGCLRAADSPFTDVAPGFWAYLDIMEASVEHPQGGSS